MSAWIFAKDKEVEQALGDVVAAGAIEIALPNAGAIFTVGDLLFISENDGSETEFLGSVTFTDVSTVRFNLALRKSKNSGARIWRPAQSFALAAELVTPHKRRTESGVAVERSLGGEDYAVRVGQAATRMDFALSAMTPQRETEFLAWLDDATEGGLLPFTIVSPARTIEAVRLDPAAWESAASPGERRGLKLPLLLVAEGEYR